MIVCISEQAEEDLSRIYAHIGAKDPEAAERFKLPIVKKSLLGRRFCCCA